MDGASAVEQTYSAINYSHTVLQAMMRDAQYVRARVAVSINLMEFMLSRSVRLARRRMAPILNGGLRHDTGQLDIRRAVLDR